ncbi:MAG: cupin domain-containing protein [Bacteroidetes bacterium]|nr:cupin domain-containing protein [Bacteroidota bacterium]
MSQAWKPNYPHTIENCVGEIIIFKSAEPTEAGEKVLVEAHCKPNAGPAMHTHHLQDEELTVVSGKMGYQIPGQAPRVAQAGETVLFKRGTPHKFWAEGEENLHCTGWIEPAHNVVYFLSAVYAAQKKSGKGEPEPFDGAWLLTNYKGEYDMPEIPMFVKKVIFPVTVFIGKLLGKYKHFSNAPSPLN